MNVGAYRDAEHRYQWNESDVLPSVTTIGKVLDKSGPLVGWAKRITAEAAVSNATELPKWIEMAGPKGAADLLTKAADYKRDTAADLGSAIHNIADRIVKGQVYSVSEEQQPFVDAYMKFIEDWKPEFLLVEAMVFSLAHRYAGTLDLVCRLNGETWLIDIKTGKGVYPDYALQLAAYGYAEFVGLPGDPTEYAIPDIERWGVLHVRPEGYELHPMAVDSDTFDAFLACRSLYTWNLSAKGRLGPPHKKGAVLV